MLSSTSLIQVALHRVAGDPLRAWMGTARGAQALALAVERGRGLTPRILAPVGYAGGVMPYDVAVAWLLNAAERLSEDTHYDEQSGAMIKDETGASGSTHGMIDAYLTHDATSPSPVHMAAAEVLRVHSGRQLDRQTWEAAYTAVKNKFAADGNTPPPPGQAPAIYRRDKSVASGLKDGTKYSFDGKKVHMRLQLSGDKISARDLLREGGVPDSAWMFYVGAGETAKRWIAIDPAYVSMAADALAAHYPSLADALRQNEPSWVATAGVTRRKHAAETEGAGAAFDPAGGTGAGWSWKWTGDGIIFSLDTHMGKLMDAIGFTKNVDYRWKDAGTGGVKAWNVVVAQGHLGRFAEKLDAIKAVPAFAAQVRQAAAHHGAEARPLEAKDEGRWEMRGDGLGKLYTSYRPAAKGWQDTLGLAWDREGGRNNKGGEFHWLFRPAQAVAMAAAMRPHWPMLADAIVEAFRDVPQSTVVPAGDDAPTSGFGALPVCAAQSSLAHAAEPSDVTDPVALQHLADVQRALTQRLPVGVVPFPYQVIGAAFGRLTNYRYLNGDAMGVGKTITTLCNIAVDPEKLLPAVVVAPSSVVLKWAAEIRKWLPSVPVHLIRAGADALPPAGWKGIVIVSWSLLEKFADRLGVWGVRFFVGDEIHYIKNQSSLRSKAARTLSRLAPHAAFLSGTPLLNRLTELWHPLSCLDEAAWGGTVTRFQRQFMEQKKNRFIPGGVEYFGIRNKPELLARLSCFMVNRLKSQVAKWLPDKTRNIYPIDVDKPAFKQAYKDYKFIENNFEKFVTGRYEEKAEALYNLMVGNGMNPQEAREKSNAQMAGKVEKSVQNEQLTVLGYLRQALGKLKIPAALDMAEEILDTDQPVILYAEFHATIKLLKEGLAKLKVGEAQKAPRVVVIDGKLSADQKYAAWTGFQDGKYDVVIGSSAMREGIDLFRASQGIFVERWWVPALETQAEDRMHRTGQKNAVTIWYPTVPGTIDEHMAALAEKKRAVLEAVLGAEDIDIRELDTSMTESIGAYLRSGKGEKPVYSKNNPNARNAPGTSGKQLPPTPTIHALLFTRDSWSGAAATHWARMHNLECRAAESKGKHYQVLCRDAANFRPGTFRSVRVTDTVTALVAQPGRRH